LENFFDADLSCFEANSDGTGSTSSAKRPFLLRKRFIFPANVRVLGTVRSAGAARALFGGFELSSIPCAKFQAKSERRNKNPTLSDQEV